MNNHMGTWKKLIEMEFEEQNESWEDVEFCTLSKKELNKKFHSGYGSPEGIPFCLWTKKRVYFPSEYDGSENVRSASRVIDKKPMEHI